MLRTECLCGDVCLEVPAPLQRMRHCHCSVCRKMHGSAFATFAPVAADAIHYLRGEGMLKAYRSSSDLVRYFCPRCGSAMLVHHESDDRWVVAAGPIEGDPGIAPSAHIFADSAAPWYSFADDLPRHEGYPEQPGKSVEAPPRHSHAEAGAAGSCQCGAVGYEFDGEPVMMWYCHCSRCRRARGAAHGANVFVPSECFRWLSGEDKVAIYKLPEAERFAQAFCTECGSAVPRVREGFPLVVIPAGGLDDDPGIRSGGHIYVGSRAGWFEPGDDLPHFPEMPPR